MTINRAESVTFSRFTLDGVTLSAADVRALASATGCVLGDAVCPLRQTVPSENSHRCDPALDVWRDVRWEDKCLALTFAIFVLDGDAGRELSNVADDEVLTGRVDRKIDERWVFFDSLTNSIAMPSLVDSGI